VTFCTRDWVDNSSARSPFLPFCKLNLFWPYKLSKKGDEFKQSAFLMFALKLNRF